MSALWRSLCPRWEQHSIAACREHDHKHYDACLVNRGMSILLSSSSSKWLFVSIVCLNDNAAFLLLCLFPSLSLDKVGRFRSLVLPDRDGASAGPYPVLFLSTRQAQPKHQQHPASICTIDARLVHNTIHQLFPNSTLGDPTNNRRNGWRQRKILWRKVFRRQGRRRWK